jgi:hypothetical protein
MARALYCTEASSISADNGGLPLAASDGEPMYSESRGKTMNRTFTRPFFKPSVRRVEIPAYCEGTITVTGARGSLVFASVIMVSRCSLAGAPCCSAYSRFVAAHLV